MSSSRRWVGLVLVLVLLTPVASAAVTTAESRATVGQGHAPAVVQSGAETTETTAGPSEATTTTTEEPEATTTEAPAGPEAETTTESTPTSTETPTEPTADTTPTSTETPTEPTDSTDTVTELDSCQVIRDPGRYELTTDVTGGQAGICIHVRASDVVLDGNGNAVTGAGASDSVGVFVYNGSAGEEVDREDSLSNVTVRDVRVTNWDDGVVVGDMNGIGTEVTLRNVEARNNANVGVSLTEVGGAELVAVTASENRFGMYLWETHDSTARGVTVADNDEVGLYLAQEIHDNVFRDVRATGNGPGGRAAGIYLSTDVENNSLSDVYAANNAHAGIRFSDSYENTVRDAVSEANGGPGILGIPANGDRLQNVTVRDNDGPVLSQRRGGMVADGLHVGSTATLSFDEQPVEVGTVDRNALPGDLPGDVVSDRAINVTGVQTQVDLALSYGGEGSTVELWRFDGSSWLQVEGATVDEASNEVSATVTGDGIFVAVRQTADGQPTDGTGRTATGPTATTSTERSTSTGTSSTATSTQVGTGDTTGTATGSEPTAAPGTATEVAAPTGTDEVDPADTTTPGPAGPGDGEPVPTPSLVVVALVVGLTMFVAARVGGDR
ncbi:right-handed parallel beta-helix repeat-containing protein [Haloarchaeobius sp. HRN-SO-5]|uniref:right-handed parallel beta-helix repeat-containing protein n=1 Tax=Haloarchaeobius sp. HRN-SO-5 TaxID=3446118 RepID=UPI003EB92F31